MGKGIVVVVAAALVLGGCQTDGAGTVAEGPQTLPPDYRQQIIAKVKESFFDPYSIRDASISAPIPGANIYGATNTVCVRANAKNRMGGYIGLRSTMYVFNGPKLTVSSSDGADWMCAKAAWEPFPEIEEGYKPPAAQPAKRRG